MCMGMKHGKYTRETKRIVAQEGISPRESVATGFGRAGIPRVKRVPRNP